MVAVPERTYMIVLYSADLTVVKWQLAASSIFANRQPTLDVDSKFSYRYTIISTLLTWLSGAIAVI